jgi:hypothetical protein
LIVCDEVGVGSGVVDRIRELGEFRIVGFNSARRARRPRDFPNRRSELWFEAAELLPLLDLDPRDDELAADLLAPTFSFASDGGRVVEQKSNTKKRLRRSPDRADALLLTLAHEPPRKPGEPRRRRVSGVPRGRIPLGGVGTWQPSTPATRAAASYAAVRGVGRDPLVEKLQQLGVDVHGNAGEWSAR